MWFFGNFWVVLLFLKFPNAIDFCAHEPGHRHTASEGSAGSFLLQGVQCIPQLVSLFGLLWLDFGVGSVWWKKSKAHKIITSPYFSFLIQFFPTCQVRVVRFYVSCLLLLLPPPASSCLLPPPRPPCRPCRPRRPRRPRPPRPPRPPAHFN